MARKDAAELLRMSMDTVAPSRTAQFEKARILCARPGTAGSCWIVIMVARGGIEPPTPGL